MQTPESKAKLFKSLVFKTNSDDEETTLIPNTNNNNNDKNNNNNQSDLHELTSFFMSTDLLSLNSSKMELKNAKGHRPRKDKKSTRIKTAQEQFKEQANHFREQILLRKQEPLRRQLVRSFSFDENSRHLRKATFVKTETRKALIRRAQSSAIIWNYSWDYHSHFDPIEWKRKKIKKAEKKENKKKRESIDSVMSSGSLSSSISWITDFSKRSGHKGHNDDTSVYDSDSDSEFELLRPNTNTDSFSLQVQGIQLEEGKIVAGLIESLLLALAHFHFSNNEYIEEFLFSFRSFIAPIDVLKTLINHFASADDENADSKNPESQIHLFVRLRIVKVLKTWLNLFYFDFSTDSQLFNMLGHFISEIMPKYLDNDKYMIQLQALVQEHHPKQIFSLTDQSPIGLIEATMRRKDSKLNSRPTQYKSRYYNVHQPEDLIAWLMVNLSVSRSQATDICKRMLEGKALIPLNSKIRDFRESSNDHFRLAATDSIALPPRPIVPKKLKDKLKFIEIDATECARQMSLYSSTTFHNITPKELMNPDWCERGLVEMAPNAIAFSQHFNEIASWVATEVVLTPNLHQRTKLVEKFITVAHECLKLENFFDCGAIISGLSGAAVGRLKRTWAGISSRTQKMFKYLEGYTPVNQRVLRNAHSKAHPPSLPNFGLILGDLIRLKEAPSKLENGYINFRKYRVEAQIFRELDRHKSKKYPFKAIPEYQNWLANGLLIERNEAKLFQHSRDCEPAAAVKKKSDQMTSTVLFQKLFGH